MKTIITCLCLSLLPLGQIMTGQVKLYGTWKLVKVTWNNEEIIPIESFQLTINAEKASYNLEVNGCESSNLIITENSILMNRVNCTMICCDSELGNGINYSGDYKIKNDTLSIINDRIYTFIRQ